MRLTNVRLQDKKPLSQKLIVRNSRFHEFWTTAVCAHARPESFEETEAESLRNVAMLQIQE